VPFFENAVADLGGDRLAMLIRADLTNRLWRADSSDGGRTWGEPQVTEIPNPGSKPRIINLPDGRIVLFHNPNEKDYEDLGAYGHKYRTPLPGRLLRSRAELHLPGLGRRPDDLVQDDCLMILERGEER